MAEKYFEVRRYTLSVRREPPDGASRAHVACYGDEKTIFIIYFTAPGSEKPPVYSPESFIAAIYRPIEHLPLFVDLLRNEKHVYAYMNSINPTGNCIVASKAPVEDKS